MREAFMTPPSEQWAVMDEARAYAMGRNSVWNGESETNMVFPKGFTKAFLEGRRDALAEVRLDHDTEWDED